MATAIKKPTDTGAAVARSGQTDEAGDLLAPVYRWFTEGFDTLDLRRRRCSTSCTPDNQFRNGL
jgi:hypothetical protein